ncbi:MAG: hypothetical protein M9894_24440 [Planctomycetes bacterium]|nr:hypothetical protein [Planctomycetota bacterium]
MDRPRALLAALSLVALLGMRAAAEEPPPAVTRIRGEVAALASDVDAAWAAARGGTAFVSTASSVNFIPEHAWILTLWVADAPVYGGVYFVLSEIDGRLVGELLRAPGPDGTLELTGDDLAGFLRRVELDPAPIRAVFDRHYRRPARERRRPRRRARAAAAAQRRRPSPVVTPAPA